jgi:hypothetical protein
MSHLIGRVLRVTREVPWPNWHQIELDPRIKPGAIVHEYKGYTWGCMAAGEIAVSLAPGVEPFWGIPCDALEDWPGDDPIWAGIRDRAKQSAWRMIREAEAELSAADEEA